MQASSETKRVAIIGSGIAGLTSAWLLHKQAQKLPNGAPAFEIVVFECADRLGGHTATVDVASAGGVLQIDTGFIVYNDWTYPNFIRLLEEIGVENQVTDMSFSVSCADTGLEYSGNNLDTLFAQRKNLLSQAYLRMLWNIVRFNKQSVADLAQGNIAADMTLGKYLQKNAYDGLFVSHYLVPMCAAIWSASTKVVVDFPLLFFVQFFKNHGLLSITNRPQWRVIRGGSKQYIAPLTQSFADRIRLNAQISKVTRTATDVQLLMQDGQVEHFDEVVFACHSDQALQLLGDASAEEQAILGAIPYLNNEVVLHTDARLLPQNKKTWAAWNYLLSKDQHNAAVLSYDMNILQSLPGDTTYCVTLNATDRIDPRKIIGQYQYAHPSFSLASAAAQQQWPLINGINRSWFCGAYWGNGFHEDGVVSAQRVAQGLGVTWS